jgi:predicted ATPase/class 3 adenylate cyclase
MTEPAHHKALLLTDLVDSAALTSELGDVAFARLSAAHDRLARDLLQRWDGREIDKTDGFLLLFDHADRALGYALDYHRALRTLPHPLRARVGLHVGEIQLRATPLDDVARGAKPIEVDGVNKPLAARVRSTALGGQTLLTASAVAALSPHGWRVVSHGHWRVKGLPEPLELFEVGDAEAPFVPPPDGPKVYRVVHRNAQWLPFNEVPHSLPAERDHFVGRKAALRDLGEHFERGSRLISLLGIGGCGKTRVATRFGWFELGHYPGGVWFCDLAQARDLDGLVGAVAQGLGVPLGPEDPVQQLGTVLQSRGHCLVILDNFEQVARHAEATLGRWLERARQVCFLVTSREVLGIPGEQAVVLAPLSAHDAEALFMRRAQAAKHDFQPGPEDLAAIGPLVRLLDGLPLAIELAAARVRALPPRALLARMSERFKLLAGSGHRVDRQATLRAAFDWSWDLLSAAERSTLAQLSVFEGSFDLDAADAVIDLGPHEDAPWLLDLLQSLVDKSFVRSLADDRFDLLQSVQAYAADHLATPGRFLGSGPEASAAAVRRHAAWYAAMDAQRATANGCIDLDNLSAACRRACLLGATELAVAALAGAWAALALQGPFHAGLELADRVCALPGLGGEAGLRAWTLRAQVLEALARRADAAAAYAHAETCLAETPDSPFALGLRLGQANGLVRAGQLETALPLLHGLVAQARRQGQPLDEVAALNSLGRVQLMQGDWPQARASFEAGLALARRLQHARWQVSLQGNLATLHVSRGDLAEARRGYEQALDGAQQIGDRQREGDTQCNLGLLHWIEGRWTPARQACEAALKVARHLGHVRLEGTVLCNLGLVREAEGDLPDALALLLAAQERAQRNGDALNEGLALAYAGRVQAALGAVDEAQRLFERSQGLVPSAGDPVSLALLRCCEAEGAIQGHDPARAQALWQEARALAEQSGVGAATELGVALARLERLLTPAG